MDASLAAKIQPMSIEELQILLKQLGFMDSVTSKLVEEEIDWQCFLQMNEKDVAAFNFKTGSMVKLCGLLERVRLSIGSDLSLQESTVIIVDLSESQATKDSGITTTIAAETPSLTIEVDSSVSTTKEVNYNVISMIEKNDEGKKFLDEYSKNPQELITDAQRCLIVQICLTNLIDQTGVYYPSAATKERLAKEIVDTFPSLKIKLPGLPEYSHFYNNKSNSYFKTFFEKRRSDAGVSKRKRKPPTEKTLEAPVTKRQLMVNYDKEKEMVSWMKDHVSNSVNKKNICEYMAATFQYRRYQIDKVLTDSTKLLEEYPRFFDYDNGMLIIEEFYRLFQSAVSFDTFSEYYVDRILAMALTSKMALHPDCHHNCSDKMLSSLIYLLLLKPLVRKTKIVANQDSFVQEFIVFKKENFDIRELEAADTRSNFPIRPFLLCLGTLQQPISFNVVVDQTVIPCGESVEHAFKVLYCSYHSFHLVFPKRLNTFYKFFDGIIFRVSDKIVPTCLNLKSQLDSIALVSIESE